MKAIISTTFHDNYLFFLPITTYSWNKLGVDVVCFCPNIFDSLSADENSSRGRSDVVSDVLKAQKLNCDLYVFECPKNKEATYAQCSRLYGGALDLPDDEILITSDIDMAVFEIPPHADVAFHFTVFGADLVPEKQYPMCYISATKKDWRSSLRVGYKTVQQCLDELLGHIDCENMRGNYWGKDQETAFDCISDAILVNRSNGQNQFATRRLDRDDSFLLERDMSDVMDYHMNRPGFDNIETIVQVFRNKYPEDNHDWMIEYAAAYKALL
jgi:hypothetical protein